MTDRELLAACIRHDPGAWRALIDRYEGGLRAKIYRRCAPFLNALSSTYQDDILGAFYRRLVESDMRVLRSFDWQKGTALFKWFARLVRQCANEYLSVELAHGARRTPVSDAMAVADEGGVLASGVRRFDGSLSARVSAGKARAQKAERKQRRKARRRRRRAS